MNRNKVLVLLLSVLLSAQLSNSQNDTNSPFTRFGYGEITDANSAEQRSMGGLSLGSRSGNCINTVNPASYSAVDSMTFMFDLGVSARYSRISDQNTTKNALNSNLDFITMQFPLAKNIGFSAGLLPYSFAGYNFFTTKTEVGADQQTLTYTQSFSGSGGFSQVYTGLSAKFFDHISIGANAYYMFGSVNNYRNLSFDSISGVADTGTPTTEINQIKANSLRFRFGLQAFNTFNEKHNLTLGLILEKKMSLNGSTTKQTATGAISSTTTDETDKDNNYELPTVYGIGLGYTFDEKLTLGVDYSMQEWSKARFAGKVDSLVNRSKLVFGVQFIPNPKGRKFTNRIHYRAGFNISDAYIKATNETPKKNYGVSFGLGLPVQNKATSTTSMLNLAFEYGKIGGISQLKEDYFKVTMSIAFKEHWFFKRKL